MTPAELAQLEPWKIATACVLAVVIWCTAYFIEHRTPRPDHVILREYFKGKPYGAVIFPNFRDAFENIDRCCISPNGKRHVVFLPGGRVAIAAEAMTFGFSDAPAFRCSTANREQ